MESVDEDAGITMRIWIRSQAPQLLTDRRGDKEDGNEFSCRNLSSMEMMARITHAARGWDAGCQLCVCFMFERRFWGDVFPSLAVTGIRLLGQSMCVADGRQVFRRPLGWAVVCVARQEKLRDERRSSELLCLAKHGTRTWSESGRESRE